MSFDGKVVFVTQARTGSTRLPGKVMREVVGNSVLYWFLCRALRCESVFKVCLATTVNHGDDVLVDHVAKELPEVYIVRGPEEDVLSRYMLAAEETKADIIVRVTSDCPFFDWNLVDQCVGLLKEKKADAVRTLRSDFPIGLDVEVFSRQTLAVACKNAKNPYEREHVGPYIFETNVPKFDIAWVGNAGALWPECRLTLDYPEDFELVSLMYAEVGPLAPSDKYRSYLIKHPEAARINTNI